MSKREFLEVLRETLSEELSQNVVNGHIQYYDQYISDEIRKGASETEVTGRLGDPRLIARTILETSGASGSSGQDGYGSQSSYSPIASHPTARMVQEVQAADFNMCRKKCIIIPRSVWFWES